MATTAVGLRFCERGFMPPRNLNYSASMYASEDQTMSPINGSAGHHRSYSDIYEHGSRPRLPSISNFLEGAGRPELNRSSFHDAQSPHSAIYPTRTDTSRGSPLSPGCYRPWSAEEDLRRKSDFDQRPRPPTRNSTDNYLEELRYQRREDVVLQQTSQPYSSHISREPPSPDARAATKHVVREEDVPGKGLCYVYDDGTVCQKVINGDTVNPKWGTTKAGKPRKRLGQACNTCREKKIKCDPGFGKCSQCQKFNRECRFEAALRTTPKSPRLRPSSGQSIDSHSMDNTNSPRKSSVAPTDGSSPGESGQHHAPRSVLSDHDHGVRQTYEAIQTAQTSATPTKRARRDSSPADSGSVQEKMIVEHSTLDKAVLEKRTSFGVDIDPMLVDAALTKRCLEGYFSIIISPKYGFLPEKSFIKWVETDRQKSPEAILMLYCVLTVGSLVDPDLRASDTGRRFVEIARTGVTQTPGTFSLYLIHARLTFCMHEFSMGHTEIAWDLCGGALRAACAIGLNTEAGIEAQCRRGPTPYSLDSIRMAECMRRTFWVLFLQDQFGVACLGFGTTFSKNDLFIRLPCSEAAYAQGEAEKAPILYVEDGVLKSDDTHQDRDIATLARQIYIASLSCDIHILATRTKHQASLGRGPASSTERQKLEEQLNLWEKEYSMHLAASNPSVQLDKHAVGGLHVMYHYAYMDLHRHLHHSHLTRRQTTDHVNKAFTHACRTLDIARQMVSHGNTKIRDYRIAISSPVTGFAILTALDIVTAAGLNADLLEDRSRLMESIMGGVEFLDVLANHYASAREQQEIVSRRVKILLSSVRAGVAGKKAAFYVAEPISLSLGMEDDLIYGLDRIQYLHALGGAEDVQKRSDLVRISIPQKQSGVKTRSNNV